MDQLPAELIAHIFLLTSQDSYVKWGPNRGLLQSLLSVSSVCSRWRAIALSTPKLWTYIGIWPIGTNSSVTPIISRVQAHLERSSAALIDIHFNFTMLPNEKLQLIWPMVSSHLHRSRSIRIFGLNRELVSFVSPLSRYPLKYLETLHFSASQTTLLGGMFLTNKSAPPLV